MCSESVVDEDSAEVYRVVSENKIGLVTQMIADKGLKKASKQLNMSPLEEADINPVVDDEDATIVNPQPAHHRRRQQPRTPDYAAEDYTETGTGGGPEMQTSQVTDRRPEIEHGETMSTARGEENPTVHDNGDQKLRGQPEGPRVRRVKPKKGSGDPRPAAVNQL